MKKIIISITLSLLPCAFVQGQGIFGRRGSLLNSTGDIKRGNPYAPPSKPIDLSGGMKGDQVVRYSDGTFYGTTKDGKRYNGRLVMSNGDEYVGYFDDNGQLNGNIEISYVNKKAWIVAHFDHGTPNGSASMYEGGKYYDVQYSNGEVVASIEVSDPKHKGENWYAKTLYIGVPHHQFFGSGGAGTYKVNEGPRIYTILCPNCYGAGRIGNYTCNNCGGLGTLTSYK